MKAITLLYHDSVEKGHEDASGFPGAHAAVYKLEFEEIEKHFSALADSLNIQTSDVNDFLDGKTASDYPFFLTFDDGGISAASHIAGALEKHGWIGHFFITAGFIDEPAFVSKGQIREMRRKGHIIGSHSWSHPSLMGKCSPEVIREEWTKSVERLSDILGEKVETASIPGGYYTREVAKAASVAGIRALFTSEPAKEAFYVDECLVLGRYTIARGQEPELSVALASETFSLQQLRQYLYWNTKKAAKKIGGNGYVALQKYILNRRAGN